MEFTSILTEQIAIANQLQDYSTYFWMRFLNDWLHNNAFHDAVGADYTIGIIELRHRFPSVGTDIKHRYSRQSKFLAKSHKIAVIEKIIATPHSKYSNSNLAIIQAIFDILYTVDFPKNLSSWRKFLESFVFLVSTNIN